MPKAPDILGTERELFNLQEEENRLHQEVGAARQKVKVLEDLRARNIELQSSRQALAMTISKHKMLEAAFGKEGR